MTTRANARVTVEIAIESTAGAVAAVKGGADRIEVCQSLGEGGLTPSAGLCAAVCATVAVPVFVMIRPRGGDFLYSRGEFEVMRRDIAALRAAGASGFVTGMLSADGSVDAWRMAELVHLAGKAPVTFHRAFDLCADADLAIDALCELGVARVLTSGQAASAPEGQDRIRRTVEYADDRLVVMAGAGVRVDNVNRLCAATGVREVHLSATGWQPSQMAFRRPGVSMAPSQPPDEYTTRMTDEAIVAQVVAALRNR